MSVKLINPEDLQEPKPAPKKTLSKAASMLFHIASRSHSLRDFLGIDVKGIDENRTLVFLPKARPWLVDSPFDNVLTFDADTFAKSAYACSDGESYMRLWLLNVWNPGYAKSKGWNFDLVKAMGTLDQGNRECIAYWIKNPVWP